MLYLIVGGLAVVALVVVLMRKSSGDDGHAGHDEAMWTGHSDAADDGDSSSGQD